MIPVSQAELPGRSNLNCAVRPVRSQPDREMRRALLNADKLKIKSGLVIEITRAVRKLGLTQEEAGRRMGIAQSKVSALLRGDFSNLSERKLMDCLNRLGYDIEIKVKPARKPVGHLTIAIA